MAFFFCSLWACCPLAIYKLTYMSTFLYMYCTIIPPNFRVYAWRNVPAKRFKIFVLYLIGIFCKKTQSLCFPLLTSCVMLLPLFFLSNECPVFLTEKKLRLARTEKATCQAQNLKFRWVFYYHNSHLKPIKYVYGGSLDGSYLYENGKKKMFRVFSASHI